jgi:signal transduction histidine kinase
MSAVNDEVAYYKQRVEDLGKRLIAAEERRRLAQIEADRASKTLSLMRQAHQIADEVKNTIEFSDEYLHRVCDVLFTDGAAILHYDASRKAFRAAHRFGTTGEDALHVPFADDVPDFDFLKDARAESPLLGALAQTLGFRHLAWAWSAADQTGLVLVRRLFTGPRKPFSATDKEVVQSALSIYCEVLKRKQTQESLVAAKLAAESASASKSRFLTMMSHELRTPLNAVLGFSDIIRQGLVDPPEDAKTREYAEVIHQSGSHLLSIISDILDISRIETGRYDLGETRFDVCRLLAECVRMVQTKADEKKIVLQSSCRCEKRVIYADERIMKQVIVNILFNAVKFTHVGGTVRAEVHAGSIAGIDIEISDNGVGMTQEEVAVALEPFGQVGNPLRRGQDGIGLGLPLARAFGELHGGVLFIDSAKDRGTTVTISLPEQRVV